MSTTVGWTLVAGFVVFLVGAAAWRPDYEQPLPEALRVIHGDRRRRAWIHGWMIPAMFITTAGMAGLAVLLVDETARVLAVMATAVYALGAVCWIVSLMFRLTVVPWAAELTVRDDRVPEGFAALDGWAGGLYLLHMMASYATFVLLGGAVLAGDLLPAWSGWVGVVGGALALVGLVVPRGAGAFNPPILAHLYTAVLGVVILVA